MNLKRGSKMDDTECKDCVHYGLDSKCEGCCYYYPSKFKKKSEIVYVAINSDGRIGGTVYKDKSLERTLNKDWFLVPFKQMIE